MAANAVDGQMLSTQDGGTQAAWAGRDQDWIAAHNLAIGFTTNPDEMFQLGSGPVKSISQMGTELRAAGYTGPWDRGSIISVYGRTATTSVLPYSPAPVQPTGDARGGHVTDVNRQAAQSGGGPTTPVVGGLQIAGNPWQWLSQQQRVLGVPVPGWMLAGGALMAFTSLRKHR